MIPRALSWIWMRTQLHRFMEKIVIVMAMYVVGVKELVKRDLKLRLMREINLKGKKKLLQLLVMQFLV
ncbi:hypothetical protein FRX31_018862 [Thalictrum thalictroides]|uniref:Uncharacterized protein n=1 Tax=Thalictrum thalictroides TaxID=46969 RepID=A0A7J6W2Z6_THATH|nr:hypothetical protein FRX31_018862 [Thalictrum thalictroides]